MESDGREIRGVKDMIWVIGLSVFWVVCGILNYGFEVAYFQGEWPEIAQMHKVEDRVSAIMASLFGPFALFAHAIVCDFRHGFRW